MRSQFIPCACGFLLAVSCNPAAMAQSAADTSPGASAVFGISGEATNFDFDVVNSFASAIGDTNFVFLRQPTEGADFNEWGGGGNVHFLVPFTDNFLGFDGFQLTAGGSIASGEGSGTQTLGALEFYDVLPIDGEVSPGAIATGVDPDPNVNLSDSVDFHRAFGMPALRGSFGDGMISVNVGPLVEFKRVELGIDQTIATTALFDNLNEDVDIWTAGPTGALSIRMPLGGAFEWFASGRAALLWANGQLDAHQEYDVGGGPVSLDVSDEQNSFATLLRATSGFSVTYGSFSAEVYGTAEWRDDMYKIVNPVSAPGVDADLAPSPFEAAHLEQTDMVAFSVGLRGSIKFGGT